MCEPGDAPSTRTATDVLDPADACPRAATRSRPSAAAGTWETTTATTSPTCSTTASDEPDSAQTQATPATGLRRRRRLQARPTSGDNCITTPIQAVDTDRDGIGDACDTTPRGTTTTGRQADADDVCPDVDGTLAERLSDADAAAAGRLATATVVRRTDACPSEARDDEGRLPARRGRLAVGEGAASAAQRSATVTVTTTRLAMVRITVERKKGGRWVRVERTTARHAAGTARR